MNYKRSILAINNVKPLELAGMRTQESIHDFLVWLKTGSNPEDITGDIFTLLRPSPAYLLPLTTHTQSKSPI